MTAADSVYEALKLKIRNLEQNEKILKTRMERLEYAIDAVEDGIWDFDPRTGRTYFSARWFTMLGYEPGELPSSYETWANLLHPDDRPQAESVLTDVLDHPGKLFSIKVRMRTKSSEWRWIHSRGKIIDRDTEGKVSRMIGTHVDITEQKHLEDSLRLTQFVFEKASIGIFRIASDARILDVNKEAARRLGYTREELCDLSIFDIDPLVHEGNWGEIWQSLLDGGSDMFETLHRHRDGTEIPVYINSNLLEYDGQEFSIAFAQDITERKRMEQALLQAQKMESIGTLAGGIAHDFNNILAAIFGYAQLAQLNTDNQEKVHDYLRNICVASERAKELVMQILAFSRQSLSEKRPTNIGVVVKEALKLLRASIPSTIEIHDDITEELGTVEANQTQIHQVIMNLCSNSAHALRASGGKISIELFPHEVGPDNYSKYQDVAPGRYLKLIVADNGHGIEPEILTRIFEPYFTTKETGEGTGMGLATVHGIVKDHGGDIKVYSEPGVGTTFRLLFPVSANPELPVSNRAESLPGGDERILFIDDEQSLVDIGREFLTGLGYQVETKTDSLGALAAFRARPDSYDLIISDLTMPELSGEKLIRQIREIRRTIPIILSTGFSKSILSQEMAELGINSILPKPVDAYELAMTVRKTLDSAINPSALS